MKKSEILKIIREEVEVVLTNAEAQEFFDLDMSKLLDEMMPSEFDKGDAYGDTKESCAAKGLSWDEAAGKCGPWTPGLEEAWKGDPEIKQTGDYAGKTIEELCAMKKTLMDQESRTKPEQTKVDQINFAIRSKQKGPKFGKVGC